MNSTKKVACSLDDCSIVCKQRGNRAAAVMRRVGAFLALLLVALGTMPGRVQAETVTYYYANPQGTPLATADAAGNVLSSSDYRPYGAQALGTAEPGPGYTGHINDPGAGLVYMQARYYDPVVGRFLSHDPAEANIGDVFAFNRFAYADNNPLVNIDPDGRETYVLVALNPQNVNTIVTDGKGGIKLHLGNAGNMGRVVLEGVTRHEGTHQSDFYKNCDQTCGILKDAPAEQQIRIKGMIDASKSEVRATNVELDYLNAEKNKLRNQREKPDIEMREKQMKQYREDNQKTIDDNSQPEKREPPPTTQPSSSP